MTMPRSESAESVSRSSKRKGTRSVSTLTPAQLARKRANDREAQRAIRARTKEHIERLEHELEELKGQHSRDKTVQDLLRRNKMLEDELARLRDSMGIVNSSPYSAPAVFDDNLSSGSGAMPSPRMSPMAPTTDYNNSSNMPEYPQQYVLPNESWPNNVNSNVSSPSSSGNNEEYVAAYIPTSVPTSMMPPSSTMHAVDNKQQVKLEFDMSSMQNMPANNYMEHQGQQNGGDWGVYNMYYPSQNNACLTR